MRHTYLKKRSLGVQVVFIAANSLIVAAVTLGAAWIARQL